MRFKKKKEKKKMTNSDSSVHGTYPHRKIKTLRVSDSMKSSELQRLDLCHCGLGHMWLVGLGPGDRCDTLTCHRAAFVAAARHSGVCDIR